MLQRSALKSALRICLYLIDRFSVLGAQFTVTWLVIHRASRAEADVFLATIALMGSLHTNFNSALEPAFVRRLLSDSAGLEVRRAVPTLMVLGTAIAIAVTALTYLSVQHNNYPYVWIFFPLGPLAAFGIGETYLKYHGLVARICLVRALTLIVGMAIKFIWIQFGGPVWGLALLTLAESFYIISYWFMARAETAGDMPSASSDRPMWFDRARTLKLLPLAGASALTYMLFRLPVIIGAKFGAPGTVSSFVLAFYVYQCSGLLGMSLSGAFTSVLAKSWNRGQISSAFIRALRAWTWTGYLLVLVIWTLGRTIGVALFGPRYLAAHDAALIVAVASTVTLNASVRSIYLALMGSTRVAAISSMIGIVSLAILGPLLTRSSGTTGLAWSFLIAAAISGVITSFLFKETRAFGVEQLKAFAMPPR